jgi:hypothetical protein
MRGYASFVFQSEPVEPDLEQFRGKAGAVLLKEWLEKSDFQVQRNLQEFPRAWVVHEARRTETPTGLTRENREAPMQEIIYEDDPLWHDEGRHAFDARRVAWVHNDTMADLNPFLSGRPPRPSEAVKIEYPSPQKVVLDVTLESPGLVILADR